MKYCNPDKKLEIIKNAIESGFCKDWYYRAEVTDIELITENDYVILKVYNGETESDLFYAVPVCEFNDIDIEEFYKSKKEHEKATNNHNSFI